MDIMTSLSQLLWPTSIWLSLYMTLSLFIVTYLQAILPPLVVRVRFKIGAKGMALPGLICLDASVFDRAQEREFVLRHELVHTSQMRRYTPLVTALMLGWHYLGGALKAKLKGRPVSFVHLYCTNPLEREAHDKMHLPTPLSAHLLLGRERAPSAVLIASLYMITTLTLTYLVYTFALTPLLA